MADYKILGGIKGFADHQREAQELNLKQQLAEAQIFEARNKAHYLDVDKFGEQSLYKAAMGQQLSPQEEAAARFVNAKSGGQIAFDPTTGSMYQKPNIASQLGLDLGGAIPGQRTPGFVPPAAAANMQTYSNNQGINAPQEQPLPFEIDPNNEYDVQFQKIYQGLAGNPKAQQQVLTDYSKDKFNQNESQTKAAGFADRMAASNPIVNDPEVAAELGNWWEKTKDAVPLVGNMLTSDKYQSGNQAQRDFINAALRRESGAVINPDEFANARQQYFPQQGDSPQVLAQKAANRENVLNGIARSAGPAYKKPQPTTKKEAAASEAAPKGALPKPGQKVNGYWYMGGNPNDPKSWQKVK